MEILLHHTTADQVLLNDAFQFVRCQLLVINTFRVYQCHRSVVADSQAVNFAPVYPILGYGIAQFGQSLFQEVPAVRAHIRTMALRLGWGSTKKNMASHFTIYFIIAAQLPGDWPEVPVSLKLDQLRSCADIPLCSAQPIRRLRPHGRFSAFSCGVFGSAFAADEFALPQKKPVEETPRYPVAISRSTTWACQAFVEKATVHASHLPFQQAVKLHRSQLLAI